MSKKTTSFCVGVGLVLAVLLMPIPSHGQAQPFRQAQAEFKEAVVFLRDHNLWVMDVDGSNQRQLAGNASSPRWMLTPQTVRNGQPRETRAGRGVSGRNAQSGRGIRSVDFRNFTHPRTSFGGATEATRVRHGKYDNGKSGTDWEGFSVGPILYGDLTGDGQEEAVIFATSEWVGANPANSIGYGFYIYTLRDGGPKLLMMPDGLDYWKDYSPYENANDECDGWVWGVKATNIDRAILSIELSVGGRHCVDKGYKVTMKYRLVGTRLVQVGRPIKRRIRARDIRD